MAKPYPGLHSSPKTLADGTRKVYYYAWKGGPPLRADYGTPKLAAEFRDDLARRKQKFDYNNLVKIFNNYQGSRGQGGSGKGFLDLSERTRDDYAKVIARLEHEFGDMPIAALSDPKVRGVFLAWRDKRAETAPRRADYEFTILARIFAWAVDRRQILINPLERAGRVWHGSRRESVWSDADEAAFLRVASPELALAMMFGLWTGQRQGDLLHLPWSAYDGRTIRLTQGKTKVRVAIPVAAPLKAMLGATPRRSPVVLTNQAGRPWTADGFRSSWRKATAKAGVTGLTFNDLRGTAVTRLRAMGCSHAEIGSITGHKNAEVTAILEAHYAATDPALAESAIRKLETRTKSPYCSPNRESGSYQPAGKAD